MAEYKISSTALDKVGFYKVARNFLMFPRKGWHLRVDQKPVNAKRDLYALFSTLAGESLAIVMLSTELDEHVELMDRVLVFREHELSRELDRGELSREALGAAFFGEGESAGAGDGGAGQDSASQTGASQTGAGENGGN